MFSDPPPPPFCYIEIAKEGVNVRGRCASGGGSAPARSAQQARRGRRPGLSSVTPAGGIGLRTDVCANHEALRDTASRVQLLLRRFIFPKTPPAGAGALPGAFLRLSEELPTFSSRALSCRRGCRHRGDALSLPCVPKGRRCQWRCLKFRPQPSEWRWGACRLH